MKRKPVSLPAGVDAPMCSCHQGRSCDVSHDPAACSCRQCKLAERIDKLQETVCEMIAESVMES